MHERELTEDEGPRALATSGARGAFRALGHPNFRVIWFGSQISQTGFWMANIALQWQMSRLTDGDPLRLGLLYFANFVPFLLVSPFAGVIADRIDRKRMVVAMQIPTTLLSATLALLTVAGAASPVVLMAIAFGMGTTMAVASPAYQALVANAVDESTLGSAIALQAAGIQFTRVIGPAIALPLLELAGPEISYAAYAGSTALVALMLSRLRVPKGALDGEPGGFLREIVVGVAHARDRRPALACLGMVAVLSLFGISFTAILPTFAEDVLGRGEQGFGMLVLASAAGSVVGTLAAGTLSSPATLRRAVGQAFAFSIALGLFAASSSYGVALAAVALVGALYFLAMTTLNTLVQSLVDDGKRARVMSLFMMAWGGLAPIGGLWMGAVAAHLGAPATLLIGSGVCLAYAIGQLIVTRTVRVEPPAATATEETLRPLPAEGDA